MKKIVIEIETDKPKSIEIYLKEVLNTMSKNNFFSIKKYNLEIIEKKTES